MQNLSELLRRLVEAQVEFVLVGGFAAVAHGVTPWFGVEKITFSVSDYTLQHGRST
jgi:hypothetical protein